MKKNKKQPILGFGGNYWGNLELTTLIKNTDWNFFFAQQKNKTYWLKLEELLKQEQTQENIIYPEQKNIFRCFNELSPQKILVVILGQDPYHQKDQADGLAFSSSSIKEQKKLPPSLKNILKEIYTCQNLPKKISGDLTSWSRQGVFLLNSILTVLDSKPLSHQGIGWEILVKNTLQYLDKNPTAFLFWGQQARSYKQYLKHPKHLILETSHPSPLSSYRGFKGCNHFQLVNDWLQKKFNKKINWKS